MSYKLAVIGVGNMARAVISGIQKSTVDVSEILLYDKNTSQYDLLEDGRCAYVQCDSVKYAVDMADCVLLSVKPQNFPDVLSEIKDVVGSASKLYITIAAGISVDTVSQALKNAPVIRVLPNIPMTIGEGVSVVCKNDSVNPSDFEFVCSLFRSAGSTVLIDESEMNRIIGVTSSSPAYVFKFIDAIYKGAISQGISTDGLINAICDVFIGSAMLLKQSGEAPEVLISKVASKGGTTEKALAVLEERDVDGIISDAMTACTKRADELGNNK